MGAEPGGLPDSVKLDAVYVRGKSPSSPSGTYVHIGGEPFWRPFHVLFVTLIGGDTLTFKVSFPNTTVEELGRWVKQKLELKLMPRNTVQKFVFEGKSYYPSRDGLQILSDFGVGPEVGMALWIEFFECID